MKLISVIAVLMLIMILAPVAGAQQANSPVMTGPYLGQKPPGTYPEVFGPGVISVDANFEHSAVVFSPDGTEVLWCTNVDFYTEKRIVGNLRLYTMKMENGKWTVPHPVPFAEDIRVERPVFSPDGNSLYFEAHKNPGSEDDMDIFVVHRTSGGWSDPEPVSPLINSPAIERIHCVTADGSMYFTRNLMTRSEKVLVSRLVDGDFAEPEELGGAYNSDLVEYAIVLGPNEDYMLVCQQAPSASANVFISYKSDDGSWGERIKTPYYSGGFLALSPDGKYLFLMGEAIYWVSTAFVDDLRP